MRRFALATAVLGAAIIGSVGTASAIEFDVGPGGVYVGPHYRYGYWDRAYDYGPGCRVVITHHLNQWGDRVVVRRRICD